MARLASILISAGDADIKIAALGATTASSAQFIGKNQIFVINADTDINIAFGQSTVGAPDATFYRIPANQQTTFDMGSAFTHVRLFNPTAGTSNIYIKQLSVV